MESFCKTLITNIRKDIKSQMNYQRLLSREKLLLKAKWIKWYIRPSKSLNMYSLLDDILNCISYRVRHETGEYCIYMDNNILLTGTDTSLARIARFIDKGNETVPGIHVMSNVFNEYQRNINKYWKAYIATVLNRIYVTRLVTLN